MEFLPGGDLMTMLIKYDTFSEDVTRFYLAECVLAIEAVHKLGFIHRCVLLQILQYKGLMTLQRYKARQHLDVGLRLFRTVVLVSYPFSDKDGHVKLSDFGLSTGFHKQHDSSYWQDVLKGSTAAPTQQAAARNSVMVNSINLTMTNKDQIATWKANRRKLVSLLQRSYLLKH